MTKFKGDRRTKQELKQITSNGRRTTQNQVKD